MRCTTDDFPPVPPPVSAATFSMRDTKDKRDIVRPFPFLLLFFSFFFPPLFLIFGSPFLFLLFPPLTGAAGVPARSRTQRMKTWIRSTSLLFFPSLFFFFFFSLNHMFVHRMSRRGLLLSVPPFSSPGYAHPDVRWSR